VRHSIGVNFINVFAHVFCTKGNREAFSSYNSAKNSYEKPTRKILMKLTAGHLTAKRVSTNSDNFLKDETEISSVWQNIESRISCARDGYCNTLKTIYLSFEFPIGPKSLKFSQL
jgi:hypothetical protein